MASNFLNKKYSDYLGEERALLDIITGFFAVTPTPTPTQFASPTPSITPTRSVTPTPSNTQTPLPSQSVTPSVSPSSPIPSVTPSNTQTPLPSPSNSATPSTTPSVTPTLTPTPSVSLTPTPTLTPFASPTPSASPAVNDFIFVIDTNQPGDNIFSFNLPQFPGESYNFNINWGDGEIQNIVNTGENVLKVYAVPGIYTIRISGTFPRIFFNGNDSNRLKIVSLERFGNVGWTSFEHAFDGCSNMVFNATDIPDLTTITSTAYMFRFCSQLVSNSVFLKDSFVMVLQALNVKLIDGLAGN